jgi:hypothetical protein
MMDRHNKRKYERLKAKFEISYRRIGSISDQTHEGSTVNISPGGLYFRTKADTFKRGDLLKIELLVPPKSGLLEFGGKMAGFAKVLRADPIFNSRAGDDSSGYDHGIALQFCRPPKLCV